MCWLQHIFRVLIIELCHLLKGDLRSKSAQLTSAHFTPGILHSFHLMRGAVSAPHGQCYVTKYSPSAVGRSQRQGAAAWRNIMHITFMYRWKKTQLQVKLSTTSYLGMNEFLFFYNKTLSLHLQMLITLEINGIWSRCSAAFSHRVRVKRLTAIFLTN